MLRRDGLIVRFIEDRVIRDNKIIHAVTTASAGLALAGVCGVFFRRHFFTDRDAMGNAYHHAPRRPSHFITDNPTRTLLPWMTRQSRHEHCFPLQAMVASEDIPRLESPSLSSRQTCIVLCCLCCTWMRKRHAMYQACSKLAWEGPRHR